LLILFAVASALHADEPTGRRFLGAQTCSTSGCHGGADDKSRQFVVWSQRDFHSRSYATLTSGRSERMAEALGISDPTQSTRCTSCHAPLHEVLPARSAEGVSCENCHSPAEPWLRSHTRPDYTYADRVTAGMRDLKNLYVRANACVACHQTVETDLLKAGHPELTFELDGQAVSMPKHWREKQDWSGAQAWLVGQAVALREMNWQLSREPGNERLQTRRDALAWLVAKTGPTGQPDEIARRVAAETWPAARARELLLKLAATGNDFRDTSVPRELQARRAERLVIALERLTLATNADSRPELRRLSELIQSLPAIDPAKFADALEIFSRKLNTSASR
jgi:hypothetical protein